jgi:hypothetical protein
MPGTDPFSPQRTRRVIESRPMPLRTRLTAVHGDADRAAGLLEEAARGVQRDMERLMVTAEQSGNPPAVARRGLRLGLARPRRTRPSPGLAVVAVPAAQST